MEIGISTFVETNPDVKTGELISHAQRIRDVVEEIVLADEVGLDVYGVGNIIVQTMPLHPQLSFWRPQLHRPRIFA